VCIFVLKTGSWNIGCCPTQGKVWVFFPKQGQDFKPLSSTLLTRHGRGTLLGCQLRWITVLLHLRINFNLFFCDAMEEFTSFECEDSSCVGLWTFQLLVSKFPGWDCTTEQSDQQVSLGNQMSVSKINKIIIS